MPAQPQNTNPKRKLKSEHILAILFAIFIVVAIGVMMAIDQLGEPETGVVSSTPKDSVND